MHPKRVTVWFALWSGGFIEAIFFENEARGASAIKDEHYDNIKTQFFGPQLEEIVFNDK